ncbi:MAG: MerR family transcriptional regulator [Eubacteriales bacterium]|nr:MerR family transcriptional regulator [Eubacteriales bacterium]
MDYTIKEVSNMMNLSISTLRYYDTMGLLPGLKRKESGYRVFSDNDIEMLKIIDSFKKAGLKIKDMQHYLALAFQGENTLTERYQLFLKQEKVLEKKIEELQQALEVTRKKISYYEAALQAGTENVLPPAFCLPFTQK